MGSIRNIIRASLLATVVGVAAAPAIASADDVSTIVTAVEAKYGKVESIHANFTQTTHSATFGDDVQSGEVFLKRPRMMFWDFTSGEHRQFVTDGKQMWVWSASDNQVIQYSDISQSQGSATAESMLQSLDQLDELFTVTVLPATSGHSLDLAPKKAGQVKKVHLELTADYSVSKVVITDQFDTVTELAFSNMVLNGDVPDAKFTFKVPAGAQVIKGG